MNTELLSKNHISFFFFFNDTATTEIYTLSLHDALPIFHGGGVAWIHFDRVGEPSPRHEIDPVHPHQAERPGDALRQEGGDRKSTRLNSSHSQISYAVFCLKKKKTAILVTQLTAHLLHMI